MRRTWGALWATSTRHSCSGRGSTERHSNVSHRREARASRWPGSWRCTLTGAELDELARARRQLRQGTALFDADWSAVFSILVQTDKRRRASLWRREERASGICASPDVFVLPVEPELPAAQGTPTDLLPAWRASIQDRQAWEDRLRRRMDDDESVGRTLRTVADTVEGECLPALRESLVDAAVPEPWGTDRKAKWLGDRLLIDLASGACQRTTRAAQAIESCRMLLFSVRSGRLSATHPDLALAADDFDAEMKWLGSYATWRSAMFVSLYPDIVPLPSLRRSGTTTTAFARLVRDVRAAPAFGPDGARRIARRYADYFRDVCSLTPQATCHVPGSCICSHGVTAAASIGHSGTPTDRRRASRACGSASPRMLRRRSGRSSAQSLT